MDRMKALARLKEKRGESKMSDTHKEAKKGLLKHLIGDMQGMMAGPMKKVTVAADSEEGLKHGLERAKEVVGQPMKLMGGDEAEEMSEMPSDKEALSRDQEQGDEEVSEGSAAEEASESPKQEAAEGSEGEHEEDMSPEEIDAEIQRLMALKHSKRA